MKDSLSPSIDAFLTMIAVEKGLAENTVEAYSRDLVQLSAFLASRGVVSWTDAQTLDFRSYLSSLRGRGLSPRSITRHVVTLRRFYRFLETEGVIAESPVPALQRNAGVRKLPQTLSADDV